MKCTVLVDNNTLIDHYYLAEPALSFYIEDEEECFLLDTGYSDVFITNAERLGIDLSKIKKIVISHGHNDHTGGLAYFKNKFGLTGVEIIAHPGAFDVRHSNHLSIGSPLTKEELIEAGAILNITDSPIKVTKNIVFLGNIQTRFQFEKRTQIGNKQDTPDYVEEDTALVYHGKEGLFVLTGCSHSGICSIMETAKRVSHQEKIVGVIGGFHLFNEDEKLQGTIQYFVENNINRLYPCHCVSLQAKIAIAKYCKINEIGSGYSIKVN